MFDFLFVTKKQLGRYIVYWNEKTGEWSASCDESTIIRLLEDNYFSSSENHWLNRFVYDAPFVHNCNWSK